MPLALMGFSPPELFPSNEVVTPLGARSLLDVVVRDAHRPAPGRPRAPTAVAARAGIRAGADARLGRPSSRSGTSSKSVVRLAGFNRSGTRCSPGVLVLSRVSCRPTLGRMLPSILLPWACCSCAFPLPSEERGGLARSPALRSLAQVEGGPPALACGATLMRFVTSSPFSPVRTHPRPWLMCSPRGPSHVTALWQPLFGPAPNSAGAS